MLNEENFPLEVNLAGNELTVSVYNFCGILMIFFKSAHFLYLLKIIKCQERLKLMLPALVEVFIYNYFI